MGGSDPPLPHSVFVMGMNFDSVARGYEALERLAFGWDLEACRFHFLDRLKNCRSILILGEGDGRFLRRLLLMNQQAHVTCVEASAKMIECARARIADLPQSDRERVVFHHQDARDPFPSGEYDAAVTLFFLDCFDATEQGEIINKAAERLSEKALWLMADFHQPDFGWKRWRALIWIRGLYFFFGIAAGLKVRDLVNPAPALSRLGFRLKESASFQMDLLRAEIWER